MAEDIKEYEIVDVCRREGCVYVVWWGEYTVGIILDAHISTREELHEVIMLNRPVVVRQEGPVYDLIEQMVEEARQQRQSPTHVSRTSFIDDLIKEINPDG